VEFLARQPAGSGDNCWVWVFRAVISDPDCADNSCRSGVHDEYDVFGTDVRKHLTNIPALSIRALFDAVRGFCAKREPRTMYGCLLKLRQYSAARDKMAPAEVEQMARMSGGTYKLSPQDTTQLWSDNTVQTFFSLSTYTPLWVLVILHRDLASDRGDSPPHKAQTMFDVVGRIIRTPRLPNSGVQTNTDHLASINVIGRQIAQLLDCRSRRLKLLAGQLGFHDFCYPHEADYVPGMSEDAHRAKKRQRSFSSDPIAEGRKGVSSNSSNSSDGRSQRKRLSTSGSPPCVTEVPSREPLTPRQRIVIPGMSGFTRVHRATMIDEGKDVDFGEAGSRKGQPE